MGSILNALLGNSGFYFFYGMLELWLNGMFPYNIRSLDKVWFGIGIPYHFPIMSGMFFAVSITPFLDQLLVNPSIWLIVIANFIFGCLWEDMSVQILEYIFHRETMTEDDWSNKWGSIKITDNWYIPIWYFIYLFIVIILYLIYFVML